MKQNKKVRFIKEKTGIMLMDAHEKTGIIQAKIHVLSKHISKFSVHREAYLCTNLKRPHHMKY